MLEDRVLVLRQFDKYDENSHIVIEIGWPVEIYECSANKVAERELDALAEAILKLVEIGYDSDKEIADVLHIDPDLVKNIKTHILQPHDYISKDFKEITPSGKEYLQKGISHDSQSEKVFGQMFVSIPDQEIMPYFFEEKLPASRSAKDIVKIISLKDGHPIKDGAPIYSLGNYADKFMRSYIKYCRISKHSEDEEVNEIEFIQDEFNEVSYEDVGDENEACTTLADIEKEKQRHCNFIKILETARRKIFLKTKIVVNRESPEIFTVLSPFEKNRTNWFTKRLPWMRENNIKVLTENGTQKSLDALLNDVTQEFYIEFPELQSANFDYYININYPNFKKIKCQHYLMESFRGLYNLTNLYNNGKQVEATAVIMKSQKLLETILNNYISLIDDTGRIGNSFRNLVGNDSLRVKGIFSKYGISDCAVIRNDKWRESIKNLSYRKFGSSILDRYFLLTLEAYFYGLNPFKKILLADGAEFICKLDELNRSRNKYGAHSDDVKEKEVSDTDFKKFESLFHEVVQALIANLYEEEQSNG